MNILEYKDELDKVVERLKKDRDDLRRLLEDYESICESLDQAEEDLLIAQEHLEAALDAASQLI